MLPSKRRKSKSHELLSKTLYETFTVFKKYELGIFLSFGVILINESVNMREKVIVLEIIFLEL